MPKFDKNTISKLRQYSQNMQNEASKAAGVLEERMKTLKKEFDCDTLQEAANALNVLKRREQKALAAYEKECTLFQEQWGDLLNELVGEGA